MNREDVSISTATNSVPVNHRGNPPRQPTEIISDKRIGEEESVSSLYLNSYNGQGSFPSIHVTLQVSLRR